MSAAYMTWRRIMAHGESVALRHLNGRTHAPTVYRYADFTRWATAQRRPGRAEVRARRQAKGAA